ncbi:sensor histidine kinase [Isoptericola sp. BMS4]|uniref:sensor histidine kinase n=1 Tax=Isoptericola sp. BMS4 TaxID=2527875 RepID=UPI0014224C3F|nr:hypothetical protein [Isoptericola sp. BMS4]
MDRRHVALTGRREPATRSRRRRDRVAAAVAVVNVVVFSVLVTEQSVEREGRYDPADPAWWVGGVTLVVGLVLVGVVLAVHRVLHRWPARLAVAALLAAVQAAVRTALLLPVTTVSDVVSPGAVAVWSTGVLGYAGSLGAGYLVAWLLQREDAERARRRAEEERTAAAVRDLEAEELRVRRMVADRLHGTVQQRLVVISAGLDALAVELDPPARARWGGRLHEWAADLDALREEDVRVLSHHLFPTGADLGTVDAIRVLLDRLPVNVATSVVLGPTLQHLADDHRAVLPLTDRLVVVYTVEEAVTNALKHGGAHAVTVRAEVRPPVDGRTRWVCDVVVDDDGSGPPDPVPPFSGLERHRARVRARGGSLTLGARDGSGGRLHLVLPFDPVEGAGLPPVSP